jgi:hypothetical protein
MTEPLDPAAIMAAHEVSTLDELGNDECDECGHLWPCLPYRLAADAQRWRRGYERNLRIRARLKAALAAERELVQRVTASACPHWEHPVWADGQQEHLQCRLRVGHGGEHECWPVAEAEVPDVVLRAAPAGKGAAEEPTDV